MWTVLLIKQKGERSRCSLKEFLGSFQKMINGELIIEWRDTYIYGEKYEVSNTGLVRNKTTGQILKSHEDGKGYLRISLSRNNKQVTIKVHRAVAIAFIENPLNLPQVNHKDTDKKITQWIILNGYLTMTICSMQFETD